MSRIFREHERERDWDAGSSHGSSRAYTTVRRYKIPDRSPEDTYGDEARPVHRGRSPSRERVERREHTVERDDLLRREVREYYYLERNVERSQSPPGREIIEYRYEPERERVIYPPREYRDTYESEMRLQGECIPDVPATLASSSPISEQCHKMIVTLKAIVEGLSSPDNQGHRISSAQVSDELERFSLWVGNIGALHAPSSPLSLESRLAEAQEVLKHVFDLLDDMNEVAEEFSNIIHGVRLGDVAVEATGESSCDENQNEETELLEEIGSGIARLFRVSRLIREAAPTDPFTKALSCDKYRFNDQFDIAHVGEKYPKLASEDSSWLRTRLGRAITHRRQYLSYIRDHRNKLEAKVMHGGSTIPDMGTPVASVPGPSSSQFVSNDVALAIYRASKSNLAKETTPSAIPLGTLESDSESDGGSSVNFSHSTGEDYESLPSFVIPKLEDLTKGSMNELECPFCYNRQKFRNERAWQKHVFSDLCTYVCVFPDCDAPYFGDIDDWFRHELQNHLVRYKCKLCQNKSFANQKSYMKHISENHTELLQLGDEDSVIKLGQESLDVISTEDCPCCSDWTARQRSQVPYEEGSSKMPVEAVKVIPAVFKRHLASHLEQLALFAIDNGVQDDDDLTVLHSLLGVDTQNIKNIPNAQEALETRPAAQPQTIGLYQQPPVSGEPDPDHVKHLNYLFDMWLATRSRIYADEAVDLADQMSRTGSESWCASDALEPVLLMLSQIANICVDFSLWEKLHGLELNLVRLKTRFLGQDHSSTLTSIVHLEIVEDIIDVPWESGRHHRSVIQRIRQEARRNVDGPTFIAMTNLASEYRKEGRWREREKLMSWILEDQEASRDPYHAKPILRLQKSEATSSQLPKNYDVELRRVQSLLQKNSTLGPIETLQRNEELTLEIAKEMARRHDDKAIAVKIVQTHLEIREHHLGENHELTLDTMFKIAMLYRSWKADEKARDLMERCLQLSRNTFGLKHELTIKAKAELDTWESMDLSVQMTDQSFTTGTHS
ncbi:hypothetical protein BU24DRAFT_453311 [Aaosphaeria arxii CBS 175.79]|uniref:C2H2-type domain-containing protein n=1 Tax=Aaosphaeria arxii CBS 175.79 TaxID=1450172 RepID=A0A6A5XJB1_9PLEO|nr:uncharacterized protein BU24DRAFT_453311 [Aaosphaeria arxii CBS 175.79]KAF2013043.1 hypothetical protein BU24DRAFT_453311 [Aaosphaeria arxii CBS 175.79]